MQSASVNGIEIAYWVDGDAEHPWLVVSNSLAADRRMWEPQMRTLTQTHRVLRYDTRGHGQSEATSGTYTLPLLVSDLVGLMDAVHIDRADILGLSLGGMTGLGLALDFPERVSRLVCCDARADAPQAYADGWRQRIDVARQKGLAALAESTINRWLSTEFRANPDNRDTVMVCLNMILSTSAEGFCGCASALTKLDYAARLGDIEAPTLCVVGEEDVAAPPDVMAGMAEIIPNAKMITISRAAHMANLDNASAFNRAVTDWL